MRKKMLIEAYINNILSVHFSDKKILTMTTLDRIDNTIRCIDLVYGTIPKHLDTGNITKEDAFNAINEFRSIKMFLGSYRLGLSKIYRIAEKFGNHLFKTNVDIPIKLIPHIEAKQYLIEMPVLFTDGDGASYSNCLVTMGTTVGGNQTMDGTEYKSILYMIGSIDGNGMLSRVVRVNIKYDEEKNIRDLIDNFISYDGGVPSEDIPFLKMSVDYITKCILYIESLEPDIKPEHKTTSSRNPTKIKRFHRDHCPYEVMNVGYRWKKGMMYYKDEAEVSGHFRWQPCGPRWSRVKLIWIDEHIRKYKKAVV